MMVSRCWLVLACAGPVAAQGLSGAAVEGSLALGPAKVGLNELGVPVSATGPGLRTVDGLVLELGTKPSLWYGLAWRERGVDREAVACGAAADWAGRPLVQPLSTPAYGPASACRARAGDLGILTRTSIDPLGPYLIVDLALTNEGPETIVDLHVSLEGVTRVGGGVSFPAGPSWKGSPPPNVSRRGWMLDPLDPGETGGVTFSFAPASRPAVGGDVPLARWKSASFPNGVNFGSTYGISFGDYDADGWIDVFACDSAKLWRNLGGLDWVLAADLSAELPSTFLRYGASFGDYDNDGLCDIGTEPRLAGGDDCFHLLSNLGGGANFVDVAGDPTIVDVQPCMADGETICWGDVDGDGNLDLFLPVYPPWITPSSGNAFLYNLGPVAPGGEYAFRSMVNEAGLYNPLSAARPEGAQFADWDQDGDLDLYSNGVIYRNLSTPGIALFEDMGAAASGIKKKATLEEGAAFLDFDMDGDLDLAIVYSTGPGTRIWVNRGDGLLVKNDPALIDSPKAGLDLGLSVADWDGDGDMDFTTRQIFRRNDLIETGTPHFSVASHSIPASHISSATPSWGDWDRDGDLDCALGNWGGTGRFYENTTYDSSTPPEARRYVRVRPVRDSAALPGGLETEFGATVEVHLPGGADKLRRRQFTASASGYLNQNEYALTFGLPADPHPNDPERDLELAISVDFPTYQGGDVWRVDRHVNPALGGIDLADLQDREIRVFRSGLAVIDGVSHPPSNADGPQLVTTTGGLVFAPRNGTITPVTTGLAADHYVGTVFETAYDAGTVHVREVLVDGALDPSIDCGGSPFGLGNVAFWDITDPANPKLANGGAVHGYTWPDNDRTFLTSDVRLKPNRVYAAVARVTALRATPIVGPVDHGRVRVQGGVSFTDTDPCSGIAAAAAAVDPTRVYLAFRYAD